MTTGKTAAEQQLDFLKKLKEQQMKGMLKPKPLRTISTEEAKLAATPLSKETSASHLRTSVKRKRHVPGLPLSQESWLRLKEEGVKTGRLKVNKKLGAWAVELLLNIPSELLSLSSESKKELYQKIVEWARLRGLN